MTFKKIFTGVLATLLLLSVSAQQKTTSYDAAWKMIDTLIIKKGLSQSALVEVNKIYERAKKEKNDGQLIKALLYKVGLTQLKEEDAEKKSIQQLEKELAVSREPARSVIQNILAESYWQYFQRRMWQLYNRTTTINFNKEDIDTWGADDFHKKISELYLASLSNEILLQQTKLEPFDPAIIKGNVRYLRPTLFDLLGHRALAYFKNDERTISQPAYGFEINDPEVFAGVKEFISHPFVSNDSLSLHFKALKLYQRLLQFHVNDAKPDALIDADIDRLEFAYANAVIENKDDLYKKSLETITGAYGNLPIAAQAWYLIANLYAGKAREYNPLGDTTNRYAFVQAKEICDRVIAQPETSEGKVNCQSLLLQIQQQQLNLQTEKVNVPAQPFRTLITWKNFTQLNFRLVKIDARTKESLGTNTWDDAYWEKLLGLPVIKTFSQSLPDTKDYQAHSTEIKIDPLPSGQYALIASVNNNYSLVNNPLAVQFFYVSNIAYIQHVNEYIVVNRETGQPLGKASVQAWYRYYNASARRYEVRKGENVMTDKNGYFKIYPAQSGAETNYKLEIITNEDYLFLDDYTYNAARPPAGYEDAKEQKTTFLFTDRSIYRPGQVVYVKGIVVNRNRVTKENSIISGLTTTVFLYDVNGQKVDSLRVTTNEFGSWSGRFTLPTTLLNGQFTITDAITNSNAYINVEEYKRPKFITEITKPTGTYRLNDSIKVTGTAKAYAGNAIDRALVKYRVTRRTIIPMWEYGYRGKIWPPYSRQEMEIAHGETTTDANGQFIIPFKALPDNTIPKKDQPVFYYEVSADVTDVAGETRSGSTTVSIAYQSIKLTMNIPEKMPADSLRKIGLSSTNMNDVFEKVTVTVTAYKLKTPDRIFRERYWQQPDQFVFTQEEYYKLFPYDLYKDETDPAKWPRQEKVAEVTDTTSASREFDLRNSKFTAGWFVLEAVTKDKYGEEVKTIRYIQLYTPATVVSPTVSANIESDQTTFEPGSTINYRLNINLDSVFVIQELAKNTKDERSFIGLNKNGQSFQLPVTENDRGGIAVNIAFVKHNRVYKNDRSFTIPYTNKDLTITYATYRDKTLPGSEEKWKVKISGYKKDKVAAELLTAMYDASLDQFQPHGWQKPDVWGSLDHIINWNGTTCFSMVASAEKYYPTGNILSYNKQYDIIVIEVNNMWFGDNRIRRYMYLPQAKMLSVTNQKEVAGAPPKVEMSKFTSPKVISEEGEALADGVAVALDTTAAIASKEGVDMAVQVRKNFNETAFFFPDLKTDSNGTIEFSFTMPEAVTQWKWMSLAHSKDLSFGYSEKTIITQKDLMVQPNAPRFLREGDRMDFSGKIVNLTGKEITGQVQLQFIDPTTNQSVDGWFRNMFPNQYFTAEAGQSVPVSFTIEIPFQYNRPVTYRIIARANDATGGASDGEEAMLPVVTNRMLVTESMPLPVRGNTNKSFKFEKLLQSGNSETLEHHAVTVEYTSNPAWYAVQALPYLMEYPYECAEQVFNRYYANALASTIANASPKIKTIFERWKTADTAALLTNLQKNEELKSVLLQETPWVLQAKSEAQQKKNTALLFDMVRMSKELTAAISKLSSMQLDNGGFPWFKGGPDDRYITQYILTGIGHLKRLKALPKNDEKLTGLINTAISYLDERIKEDYDNLLKRNKQQPPAKGELDATQIQYLYMRSFFPDIAIPGTISKAYSYYRKQSQLLWVSQNRYLQGMIALSLQRTGDAQTSKNIVTSLKQNAIINPETGMYWKEMTGGYYWHQAPIEAQSLLIEVFTEVARDTKATDDLKTWLLKQKQTQNWNTTKATADACYALLLQGTNWLTNTPEVTIQLGDYKINSTDQQQEAGTGYFKQVFEGKQVKPAMGDIQVFVRSSAGQTNSGPSWGAVYWQYFEDLDKITPSATPLHLSKKLFVEKNTDRGPVLQPVNDGDELRVGDKVKVRIELRSDRTMEYVHMKDMRAACMEPVNVLSEYKWQGGLGYYETTKDASTSFFFNWLPKGTFVFEYPLFVTHTGTFSNGITNIECMYAPEFSSHSEGVKVNVANK